MSILDTEEVSLRDRTHYNTGYVEDIFLLWYKSGKPVVGRLFGMIPPDEDGKRPHLATLSTWIREFFVPKAEVLDAQVMDQISQTMVAEKVEMLNRHAATAKNMQNIGIEILQEKKDEISAHAAIRLIVEGIRIEGSTAGIPEALEKMTKMTDEDLYEEIADIIGNAPVEFLPPEE